MEIQVLLLLLVAHCSEPSIRRGSVVVVDQDDLLLPMTWSEARDICRSESSDMFTLELVTEAQLRIGTKNMGRVWTGLRRDPQNDSAWNWINTTLFPPSSGDISQTLNWYQDDVIGHCALLVSDSTLSSKRCSEKHKFFCSLRNGTFYNHGKKSWGNARRFCQHFGGDLAEEDEAPSSSSREGWIGVYREGGDSWRSTGGGSVGLGAWGPGEPVTYDCGAFNAGRKQWQSYSCDEPLKVACYKDNLVVVVTERKTWEEAMEHCESLKQETGITHKLLSVESTEDHEYVRKRIHGATTDEVWTGLRFLGGRWFWVDGKPVKDGGMLPSCPKHGEHCGVISKVHDTPWLTADCSKKLNFVCYKESAAKNP